MESSAALQTLQDRAAIHDLHVRYFQGIDASDRMQVRSCFTADIEAHYHGRPSVRGIDALIESIAIWSKHASGELKISTHFMGNLIYKRLEADVAETEINALVFLVQTTPPPDHVAMRSIRYLDRLVRDDEGWRIRERLHTLDWSCSVPAAYAITLAQRKGSLAER
jgi:hypothetical protein